MQMLKPVECMQVFEVLEVQPGASTAMLGDAGPKGMAHQPPWGLGDGE